MKLVDNKRCYSKGCCGFYLRPGAPPYVFFDTKLGTAYLPVRAVRLPPEPLPPVELFIRDFSAMTRRPREYWLKDAKLRSVIRYLKRPTKKPCIVSWEERPTPEESKRMLRGLREGLGRCRKRMLDFWKKQPHSRPGARRKVYPHQAPEIEREIKSYMRCNGILRGAAMGKVAADRGVGTRRIREMLAAYRRSQAKRERPPSRPT